MADIFLSYAREDAHKADRVHGLLCDLGWSVFWDEDIPAGERWDEVIERELSASKCVVVLWSATSLKSQWVRTEANFGQNARTLVPASLDGTQPPLAFNLVEAAQLQNWTGDPGHVEFIALTKGISRYVAPTARVGVSDGSNVRVTRDVAVPPRVPQVPSSRWLATAGVAVAVALLSLTTWGIYYVYYAGGPPGLEANAGDKAVPTTGSNPKPGEDGGPTSTVTTAPVIEEKTADKPKPKLTAPKTPTSRGATGPSGGGSAVRVKQEAEDPEKRLAADRAQILDVLLKFRAAYDARDLGAMRLVFKTAGDWIFQSEKSCSKGTLTFEGQPQIDVRAGGTQANVTVQSTYTCFKTTAQKKGAITKATDVFDMTRDSGGWTISNRFDPTR